MSVPVYAYPIQACNKEELEKPLCSSKYVCFVS